MQIAIAVDIGGTNTKLGLVTLEGTLLHQADFSTQRYPRSHAFVQQLAREIDKLVGRASSPCNVTGIGLGAPRANFFTGKVAGAVNLRWQQPVNLVKQLEDIFAVPVFVTKDANLAALGEKHFGAASHMHNFVSVTLGTGIGCGVYMNGQLQHGESDAVGELGHTSVKKKGRVCKCGKRGCLETYVSIEGIQRTALSLMARQGDSALMQNARLEELTPELLCTRALAGDLFAHKVFDKSGKLLGYKLADLISLYNPKAIFLSGGVARAGDLLIVPALKAIKKHLYKTYPDPIQLLPSALKDNEISLLGCAALVWEQLKKEEEDYYVNS